MVIFVFCSSLLYSQNPKRLPEKLCLSKIVHVYCIFFVFVFVDFGRKTFGNSKEGFYRSMIIDGTNDRLIVGAK